MRHLLILYLSILCLSVPACSASASGNLNPAAPRLGLQLVEEGLTAPIALMPSGDGTGRLFVADQEGRIWVLDAGGERVNQPFLDLRERMLRLRATYDERGLLGLAFHPDYEQNGRLFVYYSAPLRQQAPQDWDHTSHLSEFQVSESDSNRVDPESERILMQIDQPASNHNGGQIVFGADGYLYVPLGDGGGANDTGTGHPPLGNGQDTSTLLGSILRIDVNGESPYGVPDDNPFVGQDGQEEIWAYGLRNPYRISFDPQDAGQLYVGDPGQELYEEIDIVTKGGNYGWNIREGTHCFDPQQPGTPPQRCPETGPNGRTLQDPILEYGHEVGIAVIGGTIYRGNEMPELAGHYIFGDWSTSFVNPSGKIFDGVPPDGSVDSWTMNQFKITTSEDGALGEFLLSFGQDAAGELYALTSTRPGPIGGTGKIYKLVSSR